MFTMDQVSCRCDPIVTCNYSEMDQLVHGPDPTLVITSKRDLMKHLSHNRGAGVLIMDHGFTSNF
jgi:hypothetical protein